MDINEVLLDEIEDRFAKALVGEISRWDAHLWAQSQLLADGVGDYPPPVAQGLQALHQLAAVETKPGAVAYLGNPGVLRDWMVSDHHAHREFAAFQEASREWRDSPERELDNALPDASAASLLEAEIDEIERNMRDGDID